MTVSFTRKIIIKEDFGIIPLTRGSQSIIDLEDIEFCGKWNWSLMTSGCSYVKRNRLISDGTGPGAILLHRVLLGAPLGMVVDHINGNGLDNRRGNLRLASQAQNIRNSHKRSDNTSGYKGVFWDNFTGKWMAAIGFEGKFHNLGRYDSPEQAKLIYDAAAKRMFGEFVRLP